eukprot:GHVU01155951.1.p1 GENE.GHVU01155951.1~~GHVU01155951.1.p1  ORF type:complete len:698 (+),score=84.78 GHVU01155951.1:464-2557(+)
MLGYRFEDPTRPSTPPPEKEPKTASSLQQQFREQQDQQPEAAKLLRRQQQPPQDPQWQQHRQQQQQQQQEAHQGTEWQRHPKQPPQHPQRQQNRQQEQQVHEKVEWQRHPKQTQESQRQEHHLQQQQQQQQHHGHREDRKQQQQQHQEPQWYQYQQRQHQELQWQHQQRQEPQWQHGQKPQDYQECQAQLLWQHKQPAQSRPSLKCEGDRRGGRDEGTTAGMTARDGLAVLPSHAISREALGRPIYAVVDGRRRRRERMDLEWRSDDRPEGGRHLHRRDRGIERDSKRRHPDDRREAVKPRSMRRLRRGSPGRDTEGVRALRRNRRTAPHGSEGSLSSRRSESGSNRPVRRTRRRYYSESSASTVASSLRRSRREQRRRRRADSSRRGRSARDSRYGGRSGKRQKGGRKGEGRHRRKRRSPSFSTWSSRSSSSRSTSGSTMKPSSVPRGRTAAARGDVDGFCGSQLRTRRAAVPVQVQQSRSGLPVPMVPMRVEGARQRQQPSEYYEAQPRPYHGGGSPVTPPYPLQSPQVGGKPQGRPWAPREGPNLRGTLVSPPQYGGCGAAASFSTPCGHQWQEIGERSRRSYTSAMICDPSTSTTRLSHEGFREKAEASLERHAKRPRPEDDDDTRIAWGSSSIPLHAVREGQHGAAPPSPPSSIYSLAQVCRLLPDVPHLYTPLWRPSSFVCTSMYTGVAFS